MYVAEVSPASLRGCMGTLYQMSIIVRILISYGINHLLRNSGANNWRWMFLSGVVPSVVFFVMMVAAPEGPRFLAMNGRVGEGFRLFERTGGTESARIELAQIAAAVSSEQGAREGLRRPGVRKALRVSFWLAILIHVSGVNTMIDHAPAIFAPPDGRWTALYVPRFW